MKNKEYAIHFEDELSPDSASKVSERTMASVFFSELFDKGDLHNFAMAALTGILASQDNYLQSDAPAVATRAYDMAEAMMAERKVRDRAADEKFRSELMVSDNPPSYQ